ncbi:DUF3786 domain-containing protein [Desulfosudis oleivorans]|uniref:DUF3786 domain-containing protein n=1 Tax=Desulfosudis oleivorans (strain DSM 6200 / JCM 39069 / Hxd3) TaxID=96561 RepID=A8ZTB1_DESOH|nr:DUF3786 domain-containing protein [Desulfosudis oleivorans]ABW67794.1 hypothetical protein Dole_1990 [Desulfosudis oleivorans Hxd3]
MSNPGSIFEKTYIDYLAQVNRLDIGARASRLGIETAGEKGVRVPLLGQAFHVSGKAVQDAGGRRPGFDLCVVLCKYLLLCPDSPPEGEEWVTYRGLKDAGPLTVFFKNEVEQAIAACFAGRLPALRNACAALGGQVRDPDGAYDLVAWFAALPRVPLLLQFNDKDEEFAAECRLLFEERAEAYLDAECLAMLGRHLRKRLRQKGRQDNGAN